MDEVKLKKPGGLKSSEDREIITTAPVPINVIVAANKGPNSNFTEYLITRFVLR